MTPHKGVCQTPLNVYFMTRDSVTRQLKRSAQFNALHLFLIRGHWKSSSQDLVIIFGIFSMNIKNFQSQIMLCANII